MPHVLRFRTLSLACLACLPLASAACDKGLSGPKAEVKKSDIKLDLPPVPDFTLPAAPADGSHTVKELRVKGKKLLGTPVTVHGFITWAYDCPTAIRKPGETDKQVQDRIDSPVVDRSTGRTVGDPTLCERPKFYVGDAKDTPPDKSLWVVDVPRVYNRIELKNEEKKDRTDPLKCEPHEDPKKNICPTYDVGDEVVVTGTFALSSPHSENNSDGLLIYQKMKNLTKNWETPDIAPPPGAPAPGGAAPAAPPH